MDLSKLTIGEASEIAGMFSNETKVSLAAEIPTREDRGVCIVVLQRGWVAVGHLYQTTSDILIENAAIIRRWGTSKGLGELALSGPREETTLDESGNISTHRLTVVAVFDCNQEKWHDRN